MYEMTRAKWHKCTKRPDETSRTKWQMHETSVPRFDYSFNSLLLRFFFNTVPLRPLTDISAYRTWLSFDHSTPLFQLESKLVKIFLTYLDYKTSRTDRQTSRRTNKVITYPPSTIVMELRSFTWRSCSKG